MKVLPPALRLVSPTELAERPEYADTRLRSRNREALNAAIAEITRRRPSAEWIEELNARGVPSGPINRIDQAMQDPQVIHLGIATAVDHPKLGRINLVGQPVQLHRTPQRMRAATPERGADTAAVLRELGYDDDATAALRGEGVV